MQVNELKNIFEIVSILGKGFSPITEYTYVKDNIIKVTNMEAFLELKSDTTIPFNGCVLTDKMNKFLTSMNKEADLKFTVNKNTLDIHYGKRNGITIPMEDLNDFPDSPSLKYSEKDLLCSIPLSKDFVEVLDKAVQFASKQDVTFNGVFLKNNKIYSTNREILFVDEVDINYTDSIFIPYNFIKLLSKFKGVFKLLEVYTYGFKIIGDSTTLYFANFGQKDIPDFDTLINKYKKAFEIEPTEELKQALDRVSLFDEIVNVNIKENVVTMFTNNISESVDMDIPSDEIDFKITIDYLKKVLSLNVFSVLFNDNRVSAVCGESETTTILSTLID